MTYSWYSRPKIIDDCLVAEMPRVRRYARALTRDSDAADDLVQDVMVTALMLSARSQEKTDVRAWLFTILHNRYVSQIRRAVREGDAVTINEHEPAFIRGPDQECRLEIRDLDRALIRLTDE